MSNGTALGAEWVTTRLRRAGLAVDAVRMRLLTPVTVSSRMQAETGEGDWSFLHRPAILGFVAVVAICAGASRPSSPFKLEMTGTWFFGEPGSSAGSQFLLLPGVVAVYGGMVLLTRVWYGLLQNLRVRPGVPVSKLMWMFALWVLPLLVVAPLFSRDVFSYAAQGEMMSHHINPYLYGPGSIGSGPYIAPVDPLWLNTPAPYGPLFLMVDGWFASLSGHDARITVFFLRLLSVLGVVLIAYCVPKLARAHGRDHGPAFVLAVLNPLTLLALIGGAHNDAIMVGLLLAGITAAKYRHPVVGVVLCTMAAAIKVPAAMGIIYVAWQWTPSGASVAASGWRRRVRPVTLTALVALVVMGALSLASGLGFGWIFNLGAPGTVRSWMAPATAVGFLVSGALHAIGLGVGLGGVLTITRAFGLMGAAAIAVVCLRRAESYGYLWALGMSLLMFVLLGPVVQPWYLTWGVVMFAPVLVQGLTRAFVIGLSVGASFIGLTGGEQLLSELVHANPIAMVLAVAVLWGVAVMPIGRWNSWPIDPARIKSALSGPVTPEAAFD